MIGGKTKSPGVPSTGNTAAGHGLDWLILIATGLAELFKNEQ